MARLRVRMEMNQGGMGVPLQKLAGVAGEAHRFFNMLCEDIRIDTSKGQWLALEFDETSLSFTVEFVGPLNPVQVREFYEAFSGSTPLRKATIGQFARIADSIDEDEMIGFGFYHGDDDTEPHEWRSLSRRDALRIGDEMRSLAEVVEQNRPESLMPQPAELDHTATYFRDRRDHGPDRSAVEAFLRAVETRIMQRVTRLEADVTEHGVAIHSLKENSAGVEQSMKHLLVAVEDFCDRASQQFSRLPAPAPQLPEPASQAQSAEARMLPHEEPAPALGGLALSATAGAGQVAPAAHPPAQSWLAQPSPLEHGLAGLEQVENELAGHELTERASAGHEVIGQEPTGRELAAREVAGQEPAGTESASHEVTGPGPARRESAALEMPGHERAERGLAAHEVAGRETTGGGSDEQDLTGNDVAGSEQAAFELTGYELLATRNWDVEQSEQAAGEPGRPEFSGQNPVGIAPAERGLSEPMLAEPMLAEPMLAEPMLAEPMLAEPKVAEPQLGEPKLTEQALTVQAPAGRELAEQVLGKPRAGESKAAEPESLPRLAGAEPSAKPLWPWVAAAAVVLAVLAGLYATGAFDTRPAPAHPESAAASVQPTPVSAKRQERTPAPASPASVALRLRAAENCWIMVFVGEKQTFVGVLESGQSKTFEANQAIRVRTGNAGGLSIEWNGKPVGSLGPHGHVRLIEFSPKEFKYLPLTPLAKPATASTGF